MTTTEEEEEEEGLKKIYALCCWEYCKGDNSMSEILIYAYIKFTTKTFWMHLPNNRYIISQLW